MRMDTRDRSQVASSEDALGICAVHVEGAAVQRVVPQNLQLKGGLFPSILPKNSDHFAKDRQALAVG